VVVEAVEGCQGSGARNDKNGENQRRTKRGSDVNLQSQERRLCALLGEEKSEKRKEKKRKGG
jgi:hypothetical protein